MERIRSSTRSQKLKPNTGETTAIVNKTFIGMIMGTSIMKGLADIDSTVLAQTRSDSYPFFSVPVRLNLS